MTVSKKQQKTTMLEKITSSLAEKTAAEMDNIDIEKIKNYKQTDTKEKPKKLNIPFYCPSEKLRAELKHIAVDEKSSINALLLEGLELALKKRDKNINDYL